MQLQYQTARLNKAGPAADLASRPDRRWLANLPVGRKISLIAATFAVPLAALTALAVTDRLQALEHTKRELYGLQKTVPLAGVQSGLYLYVDGKVNRDQQGVKAGLAETNKGIADLTPQLQGRALERIKQVTSDWKGLQQNEQGDFNLFTSFQTFMQNNQQQLIEEMLADAGLNTEANPTLAALVSANQRRLPQVIVQVQLVALAMNLLKATPNDPYVQRQVSRNLILLEGTLGNYEEDLKRAYSIQPGLKDRVGKANDTFINAVRSSLLDSTSAMTNISFTPELFGTYSKALNLGRDAYKGTIMDLANQLIGRVKAGYVTLALQLLGLLLLLGGIVALLIALARSITRPLGTLSDASQALSQGNLNVQVPVSGRDELGTLAGSFNAAAEQLRLNAMKTEQERVDAQHLQQNINEFLNVTMDIAEGDLTRRGRVTEDVLGNVVDSINLMTEELGTVLKSVQHASRAVNDGSRAMLLTTEQIEDGTRTTTHETERLSKEAQSISQSIRQMAAIARASAEASRRALVASQQGQQAVTDTLEGMQNIRETTQAAGERVQALAQRSDEITQIVETVSHIASQVNLLSLHASIEAAGAGAAGARFAAVADEVRLLADESTAATARIGTLIDELRADIRQVAQGVRENAAQVERGYAVADSAGARLREIGELADITAQLARNISTATEGQVQGVGQVTRGVRDIATIAGASQTSAEQARSAAATLEELARGLNVTLARFRLS